MSFSTGDQYTAREVIEGTEKRETNDGLQLFIPPDQSNGSKHHVDTLVKPNGTLTEKKDRTIEIFGSIPPGAAGLIEAFRKNLPQPENRPDGGEKEETKISFRVLVNQGPVHTLGDKKMQYSMPENTTVKKLIKRIHDDLHIHVNIHLTNDKSGPAIQEDATLKGVGITSDQDVYAFQYTPQVLSGGRSLKSSS